MNDLLQYGALGLLAILLIPLTKAAVDWIKSMIEGYRESAQFVQALVSDQADERKASLEVQHQQVVAIENLCRAFEENSDLNDRWQERIVQMTAAQESVGERLDALNGRLDRHEQNANTRAELILETLKSKQEV